MKTIIAVFMLVLCGVANAQVNYFYNYSQVPVAPVVAPIAPVVPVYGGQGGTVYVYQPNYNSSTVYYGAGGKVAICQTINNVFACY